MVFVRNVALYDEVHRQKNKKFKFNDAYVVHTKKDEDDRKSMNGRTRQACEEKHMIGKGIGWCSESD